ncbi:MAG TPA: CapA family protein, partial [Dehalococcoidia bacterium]|nr:CapA family protein [Dehalococcoidia bacterium]
MVLFGCTGADTSIAPPTENAAPPYTILWSGDTLLADAAQPLLDAEGYLAPFTDLAPLPTADYVVVNLEGPITTRATPWDLDQRWSYHAQPAAAQALATIGVDAAGLANNHTLDRGPEGLADTIAALNAAGLATFGAGQNLGEAAAPLLIDTPHGVVAVVGFGEDSSSSRLAGRTTPGSLVPSYTAVQRGIDLRRASSARWLVAYVHWGANHRAIDAEQRRWAQRFADAGYDLVIGHGPHLAQPIEFVDGMPVFFALGNFVFGTPGRYNEQAPGLSMLVGTVITEDGFRRATLTCLLT